MNTEILTMKTMKEVVSSWRAEIVIDGRRTVVGHYRFKFVARFFARLAMFGATAPATWRVTSDSQWIATV